MTERRLSRRKLMRDAGAAAVGIPAAAVLGKVSADLVLGNPFAPEIPVLPEPTTILIDARLPFEPQPVVTKQELSINETDHTKIIDKLTVLAQPYEVAFNQLIHNVQDSRLAPLAAYRADVHEGILERPKYFLDITTDPKNDKLENEQDVIPFLTGNGAMLTRDTHDEPQVNPNADHIQITLGNLAQDVAGVMFSHAESRVKRINLTTTNKARFLTFGDNPHLISRGVVDWQTDIYGKDKPPRVVTLRQLFHELVHTGQPNVTYIDSPSDPNRFQFEPASGSMPIILAYNRVWMEAIANNFEFVNKRFSRQPGDEVGPMLYAGAKEIPHGVNEVIAMLCTDAVLPVDTELSLSEWPQDIVNAVSMTLNFIKYGNQSELQPMSEQEMIAMRHDLVNTYNLYMATNFPDAPTIK